jgi:hypothetical protein
MIKKVEQQGDDLIRIHSPYLFTGKSIKIRKLFNDSQLNHPKYYSLFLVAPLL